MKVFIETFVDIIVLALISFVGLQFICSNLQIQNARSFHQNVIERVESSNGNTNVINACVSDATSKFGSGSLSIQDCTVYSEEENPRPSYYVKLTYKMKMPFTGIEKYCTAEGYAR